MTSYIARAEESDPEVAVLRSAGVSRSDIYGAWLLRRFAGKRSLREISAADIDAFIQTRSEGHKLRRYWRRDFYRVFAALGVEPNPTGLGAPRRGVRLEDLSEGMQSDIRRLVNHLDSRSFSRTTKEQYTRVALEAARWLRHSHGCDDLAAPLQSDEIARKYAIWAARPREDGLPRSIATFDWVEQFLRQLWMSAGLTHEVAEAKLDQLLRSFRRNGDRKSRPDLLNLRDPNPAPAPAPADVDELLSRLDQQIRGSRIGARPTMTTRRLLTARAFLYTVSFLGTRRASIASMRADLLHADERNVWSALVLAKETPRRKRSAPTPRERVDDQTYAYWPLPAFLLPMYQEMFEAHGLDLLAFLKTRKQSTVRWVRLDEDCTFGRRAPVGSAVAPLWLDWRGTGYLREHRFEAMARRLLRRELGMSRGCLHVFRGTAAVRKRAVSVVNPGLVEKLLQMSPMQQTMYAVTVQQDLAAALGSFDIGSEHQPGAAIDPLPEAPVVERRSQLPEALAAATPPRDVAQRRPMLSLRDLLGD